MLYQLSYRPGEPASNALHPAVKAGRSLLGVPRIIGGSRLFTRRVFVVQVLFAVGVEIANATAERGLHIRPVAQLAAAALVRMPPAPPSFANQIPGGPVVVDDPRVILPAKSETYNSIEAMISLKWAIMASIEL